MSRPLSDDERRSIDMRRVDDALTAFAETPLDQLDATQWMDELDRALTPGNMRQPIEVKQDDPVERVPKRAAHHEVGDAEDSNPDEEDEFSAARWNILSDVDPNTIYDIDSESNADVPAEAAHADTEFVSNPDEALDDREAAASAAPVEKSSPRQSADPGLNLSTGLRGLLALRTHDAATAPPADPYEQHNDAAADTEPDTSGPVLPVSAGGDDVSPAPDSAPDPDPEYSTPTEPPAAPAGEDAPIPLLSTRGDTGASGGGKFDGLRKAAESLEPGTKKSLKLLAAALAAVAVVGVVRSCTTSGNDSDTAQSRPAATAESVAPTSAASTEIPVPDSAIGVLAPSSVSARCPDGSTDARLAFGSDKSKAWICKRALGIDGAVLEMTFPHPVVVTDLFLVPGFDYIEPSGIDRWVEHRVVTRVQWTVGDQRFVQEINPSRAGANIAIPSVETQKITMMVMQTAAPSSSGSTRGFNFGAGGKQDDSFAVSSIRITGNQP
jgi:hypothetical protein